MELRITNPQENWLTEQILWNNEELKAAIAEKVKDYKTIAYTEDSLKDMKADRADLNKLKKAFEDERKRVKKICMEPYTKFEQQVKEITALIDEPIGLIDSQIKELDERRKAAKREEIEELFTSIGFQSFVKLDMIWDEKWLNATVTLPKIEEQMKSRMYQIGTDVVTISNGSLPEDTGYEPGNPGRTEACRYPEEKAGSRTHGGRAESKGSGRGSEAADCS